MKFQLTIFALISTLLMIQQSQQQVVDPCSDNYITAVTFNKIINDIQTVCDEATLRTKIKAHLTADHPRHFAYGQLNQFFDELDKHDQDSLTLLTNTSLGATEFDVIYGYMPRMSLEEYRTLVPRVGNPYVRLRFVKATKNLSQGLSDELNQYCIYDAISFYQDCLVYPIFEGYDGKRCKGDTDVDVGDLFDDVNEKRIVFILDRSSSMTQTFEAGGKTYTRLAYLQEQLEDIITNLKEDQFFSIVWFAADTIQFDDGLVNLENLTQATASNKANAINYIKNTQVASVGTDGTNISGALKRAFAIDNDIDAFYFLTDGAPTVGVKSDKTMQLYVNRLNDKRTKKVVINSTSFMLGGEESQAERNLASTILKNVAAITNGQYKDL